VFGQISGVDFSSCFDVILARSHVYVRLLKTPEVPNGIREGIGRHESITRIVSQLLIFGVEDVLRLGNSSTSGIVDRVVSYIMALITVDHKIAANTWLNAAWFVAEAAAGNE
jgi:hypothetical protein